MRVYGHLWERARDSFAPWPSSKERRERENGSYVLSPSVAQTMKFVQSAGIGVVGSVSYLPCINSLQTDVHTAGFGRCMFTRHMI